MAHAEALPVGDKGKVLMVPILLLELALSRDPGAGLTKTGRCAPLLVSLFVTLLDSRHSLEIPKCLNMFLTLARHLLSVCHVSPTRLAATGLVSIRRCALFLDQGSIHI